MLPMHAHAPGIDHGGVRGFIAKASARRRAYVETELAKLTQRRYDRTRDDEDR